MAVTGSIFQLRRIETGWEKQLAGVAGFGLCCPHVTDVKEGDGNRNSSQSCCWPISGEALHISSLDPYGDTTINFSLFLLAGDQAESRPVMISSLSLSSVVEVSHVDKFTYSFFSVSRATLKLGVKKAICPHRVFLSFSKSGINQTFLEPDRYSTEINTKINTKIALPSFRILNLCLWVNQVFIFHISISKFRVRNCTN